MRMRQSFPRVLALADGHAQLFASVGVHPDQARDASPEAGDLIERARHPKIVAIGETGLDYYRQNGDLEWQRARFRTHIRAARECGKPLIIHTRDAGEDTLRIMREERANEVGGVMHCFTETWNRTAAIALNFHILFRHRPSRTPTRSKGETVPLERMLVETDSPSAPVPQRGNQ